MIPVGTIPVAPPPPPGHFEGTLIGLPMSLDAKCTVTLPDGTPYTVAVYLKLLSQGDFGFTLEMDSLYRKLQHDRETESCGDPCGARDVLIPGVHIETLHNPTRYTAEQIERVCEIAHLLHRGKFVLCEPPAR